MRYRLPSIIVVVFAVALSLFLSSFMYKHWNPITPSGLDNALPFVQRCLSLNMTEPNRITLPSYSDVAAINISESLAVAPGSSMQETANNNLRSVVATKANVADLPHLASEMNQKMDELLNLSSIPSDYVDTLFSICRDRNQDILTRDFAVQHLGLYADALHRRGVYNPASSEADEIRKVLFAAADETGSVMAASAFRALADMSEYDSRMDVDKLEARLIRCACEADSSPSARIMALQICAERGLSAVLASASAIVSNPTLPEVLRRAARHAINVLSQNELLK